MSKHYIYIMTSSDHIHLHCGYCKDVPKMLKFYAEMPGTHFLYQQYKQNMLIYLEEMETLDKSKYRFEQLMHMNREQKEKVINSCNPGWVELVPGGNIQL